MNRHSPRREERRRSAEGKRHDDRHSSASRKRRSSSASRYDRYLKRSKHRSERDSHERDSRDGGRKIERRSFSKNCSARSNRHSKVERSMYRQKNTEGDRRVSESRHKSQSDSVKDEKHPVYYNDSATVELVLNGNEKRDEAEIAEAEEGELEEEIFGLEDPEEEERRLELERQNRKERLAPLVLQVEKENASVSEVEDCILEPEEMEISCEGGETVYSPNLSVLAGKEDRPVFDMFSSSPSQLGDRKPPAAGPSISQTTHAAVLVDESDDPTLQANWTDQDGYYRTRIGEIIENRYKVLGTIGQGVFSTVLKCLDLEDNSKEVALKMIRANDTMRKAATREVSICRELSAHDPLCRKHCILMTASLEHKNHVVMVFESMQMNLRETLKKFGRRIGINIKAVRAYARQLFIALRHLASRRIVHADLKPDNILVSQGFGCLKVADFGSAFHETDPDVEPTPYLVSRWYRAPEIILGLEYDRAIDTWSVGATLFELFMGSSLFPGRDNNEMLHKMMELKGPFPSRMVKQHLRQFEKVAGLRPHFNEELQFIHQEPDPVTGKAKVRLITPTAPTKSLRQILLSGHHSSGENKEMVIQFSDFLEKCLNLDPKRRITVIEAFEHPFIKIR